jgi:hypothetical protein
VRLTKYVHEDGNIESVYGDDSLTAFEGSSTAGSKMVSAIGDRRANANTRAISISAVVMGMIFGRNICRPGACEESCRLKK